jgi:hypothetical protein
MLPKTFPFDASVDEKKSQGWSPFYAARWQMLFTAKTYALMAVSWGLWTDE